MSVKRGALFCIGLLFCVLRSAFSVPADEPYALDIVRIGDVARPLAVGEVGDLLITSPGPFTLQTDGCALGAVRSAEKDRGIVATVPVSVRRFDWSVTVTVQTPRGVWAARVGAGSRVYLPLVRG